MQFRKKIKAQHLPFQQNFDTFNEKDVRLLWKVLNNYSMQYQTTKKYIFGEINGRKIIKALRQ